MDAGDVRAQDLAGNPCRVCLLTFAFLAQRQDSNITAFSTTNITTPGRQNEGCGSYYRRMYALSKLWEVADNFAQGFKSYAVRTVISGW